jgi:hypothetical protein
VITLASPNGLDVRSGFFQWDRVSTLNLPQRPFGGRFLIPTPVEPAASVPTTVVVNWTAGYGSSPGCNAWPPIDRSKIGSRINPGWPATRK